MREVEEEQPYVVGQPTHFINNRPKIIRHTGKIKIFDKIKGFGIIIDETTKQEIHFFKCEINCDVRPHQRVNYTTIRTNRGLNAVKVRG